MKINTADIIKILIALLWLILTLTLICFLLWLTPGMPEIALISISLKITALTTIILVIITNLLFLLLLILMIKKFFTY